MTMYISSKTKYIIVPLSAAFLILCLVGCSVNRNIPLEIAEEPVVPTIIGAQQTEMSSPQQTYNVQKHDDTKGITPPDNSAKSPGTGETANSTGKSLLSAESDSKWSTDVPKLGGIAIGDSRDAVTGNFGSPADSYTLKDNDEMIHVDDYEGFCVGFDKSYFVKFVEIYDTSVNTGLGGVKVGSKEETALKALGKPSNHTTYVLSYQAKGALLKLDMDPKNREILSIKLFKQQL